MTFNRYKNRGGPAWALFILDFILVVCGIVFAVSGIVDLAQHHWGDATFNLVLAAVVLWVARW